jgi:hypothetical protein
MKLLIHHPPIFLVSSEAPTMATALGLKILSKLSILSMTLLVVSIYLRAKGNPSEAAILAAKLDSAHGE